LFVGAFAFSFDLTLVTVGIVVLVSWTETATEFIAVVSDSSSSALLSSVMSIKTGSHSFPPPVNPSCSTFSFVTLPYFGRFGRVVEFPCVFFLVEGARDAAGVWQINAEHRIHEHRAFDTTDWCGL
jgi:hypothetical protein